MTTVSTASLKAKTTRFAGSNGSFTSSTVLSCPSVLAAHALSAMPVAAAEIARNSLPVPFICSLLDVILSPTRNRRAEYRIRPAAALLPPRRCRETLGGRDEQPSRSIGDFRKPASKQIAPQRDAEH